MGLSDSDLSPAALQYKLSPGHYLGPILVGSMLDIFLFGVLAVYAATYWRFFGDSSVKFKVLVIALLIINTAQTSLVCFTVYTVFGTGFGYWPGALTNVGVMMLEAMAGCLSQLFFAERAYTLLRRGEVCGWVFFAVCAPGILAGLALGLSSGATTVISATLSTDFNNFVLLQNLIISWKSVSVFTDLLITSTIVACLIKSRTHSDADSMILKVIRWIIEAQTLPLGAALFFLASYGVDPGANLCVVPSFAEGKLCALSVLHVLNSRGHLRRESQLASLPPGVKGFGKGDPIRDTITISTVTHTRYSPAPPGFLPTPEGLSVVEPKLDYFTTTTANNSPDSQQHLDAISETASYNDDTRRPSDGAIRRRGSLRPPKGDDEEAVGLGGGAGFGRGGAGGASPLPDIDMIDLSREPVGEIRTHSMSTPVMPFEEMRW